MCDACDVEELQAPHFHSLETGTEPARVRASVESVSLHSVLDFHAFLRCMPMNVSRVSITFKKGKN